MKEAEIVLKDGKIWVSIRLDEDLNYIRRFASDIEAIEYLRKEHIFKDCA